MKLVDGVLRMGSWIFGSYVSMVAAFMVHLQCQSVSLSVRLSAVGLSVRVVVQ